MRWQQMASPRSPCAAGAACRGGSAGGLPAGRFTGQSLHIVASDNRDMLIALGRDPLVVK